MKDFAFFSVMSLLAIDDFTIQILDCGEQVQELYLTGKNFSTITELYAGTKIFPRYQYEIYSDSSLLIKLDKPCDFSGAWEGINKDYIMANIPTGIYSVLPPTMLNWHGIAFPTFQSTHPDIYNEDVIFQRILFLLHDGTDINPRTTLATPSLSQHYADVNDARIAVINKLKDIERIIDSNITDYGYSSISIVLQDLKRKEDALLFKVAVKLDDKFVILSQGVSQ